MKVSIIIVNYNTLQMTDECLRSVREMTSGVDYEIILVDNASTDGSREYFSEFPGITYIYSEENLGFGRANNLGYRYVKGEYVFLLNSDTLLMNNAVAEMASYLDHAPADVGCVGCMLYDRQLKPMHSYGDFPDVKIFWKRVVNFNLPLYKPWNLPRKGATYPLAVDYITGAALMIRRTVIEQCGLFDPDFFMYFEETEMQHRYSRAGYRRMVIDTARIQHLHGASGKRKGHSLCMVIIELESRYLYMLKTMTHGRRKFISWMHLLIFPRLIVSRAPMKEKWQTIKLLVKNL